MRDIYLIYISNIDFAQAAKNKLYVVLVRNTLVFRGFYFNDILLLLKILMLNEFTFESYHTVQCFVFYKGHNN